MTGEVGPELLATGRTGPSDLGHRHCSKEARSHQQPGLAWLCGPAMSTRIDVIESHLSPILPI
jgi:hypothetical protein